MKLDSSEIKRASRRLEGSIVRTEVQAIVTAQNKSATLKLESLQHSGSFKARGALNAMLCSNVGPDGVLAASGGNHGAAVAWAAQTLGHVANIFVPEIISPSKLEKLEQYEAVVHVVGREYQDALTAARTFKQQHACVELHAYDQREVVVGAGTLAMEIDEQVPEATTILVSCGGGGLAAGLATWWGSEKRLVVVETEGTQAWAKAREAEEPVDVEVTGVAADSLGARRIGDIGWEALTRCKAESLVVTDEQVIEAQNDLINQHDVVAEPAAAASFAGYKLLEVSTDENCVIVICGANSA